LFGVASVLLLASGSLSAPNFDRILELVTQRGGAPAAQRFQNWRNLVLSGNEGTELERLARVNDFFNRQIVFDDDMVIWNQADYWATPSETLGLGRGDCEDFVIAKYFTLRQLGLTSERLRLIYVRARTGTGSAVSAQAHMVLAYYAQPDAEPLVLDNLIGDIRPASRRPDLVPVFSFDQEGLFTGPPGKTEVKIGGVGRLSRWEDLLRRARLEGFD
jgi:predicted transglutaminase-like cysteine proteinase